jgi:hypothetical protein
MIECHDAARRQGTLHAPRQLGVLVGSPTYDPLVELPTTQNPMETKPTFAKCIRALKAATETVLLEAQRFAERRNSQQSSRGTERARR